MDIDIPFRIEFLTIKTNNFKEKKKLIKKELKKYPEKRFENFYSNRDEADLTWNLRQIFEDEFKLIETKFNNKILLQRAWSVTYDKGHYHVPHNHSSQGYTGILYLQINKDSPKTTYIQPWNNTNDQTVLYAPDVEQGDIMIVPQFLMHYTEPNKTYFKKRILSFDFYELQKK